jgi:hypothetical protein
VDTPRLTGAAALPTLIDLGGASIAAGVIARRRFVVGLLERTQADSRAIERMQWLRISSVSNSMPLPRTP